MTKGSPSNGSTTAPRTAAAATPTLPAGECMCRFRLHVLPCGVHRIGHYGQRANAARVANLARARALLAPPPPPVRAIPELVGSEPPAIPATPQGRPCPCCGGPMRVIETFLRGHAPCTPPPPPGRLAMNPPRSRSSASRYLIRRPITGDGLALPECTGAPLNVSQAVSETRPRIAVFTPLGWVEPRRSLPTAGSHLPNPSIGQTNPPSLASTRPHHPPSRGFLPRGLSDAYRRPRSPS